MEVYICKKSIFVKGLKRVLRDKGYTQAPLLLTRTNHLEVIAVLNNVEGRFIVDTGASNTCVGFHCAAHFNLVAEDSDVTAAGAGANDLKTQIAKKMRLEISGWKKDRLDVILFDLTHVNNALARYHAFPVHGIIGADILKKARAVIDYRGKRLFLKQQ